MYAVVRDMDLCNMNIAYLILDIPLHKCKWVYFYSKVLKLPIFESKKQILINCKIKS